MKLALTRYVLRRARRGCLLAMALPVLVGVVNGLAYPSWSRERDVLRPVVQRLSAWLRSDVINVDIFTPEGAFLIPFQHPLTLLAAALAAATLMLPLPAGERSRGGLEVLLSTALTRRKLVLSLAAALVPVALLLGHAPLVGAVLGAVCVGELQHLPLGTYWLVVLNYSLLVAWFGCLALRISVAASDGAHAIRIFAVCTGLAMLLDFLSHALRDYEWVRYATPLGWYEPSPILHNGAPNILSLGVLLLTSLLLLADALRHAQSRRSA
ncbi:MAG: hypothetical protein EXS14_03975 [Planctomycetes bacterium]|nr:hypothetical protein [Planctomycetota bacterium]